MGDLWRSQEMQLVQLFVQVRILSAICARLCVPGLTDAFLFFLQVEAAHDTVDELGELGLIEFRDVCKYCVN
jgi:hypothetical protein